MSFSGNVSSMSLDEVFEFLAANALLGTLVVQSGDSVSLRLYFSDGKIFFPFSSRRGTYNLGKILRHTGVLSREGLVQFLQEQGAKKRALAEEEDSEEVREAKRLQFSEEIHDLFLWGDARFEFRPGPWPPRVEADLEAGRGLQLDTTSLLMDVARRVDERSRIRQSIPSSRMLLTTVEGAEEAVVEGLRRAKIEVDSSPFDGTLTLDDLLARWGIPHHDALAAVALLVEAKHLLPVPADETRQRIRELLTGTDLEPAARLLGHWVEINRSRGEQLALDLEQEFITSEAFVSGPEESTSLRLSGPRIFTLLRVLTALGNPFTLVLYHQGWEKRVACLPGEAFVGNERRGHEPTPHLSEYLHKQGALDKAAYKELSKASDDELAARVTPEQLSHARLAKLIDELAEVVFWRRADVELCNRCNRGASAGEGLVLPLNDDLRAQLKDGLDTWAGVFEKVPGDDCLFVPGYGATKPGADQDPAARFFGRFSLERNVGEMRHKAHASRLDFATFVHRGLERGYLRAPTVDELREGITEAISGKNDVAAYRLAGAAVALGYGDAFEHMLEKLRREEAALPSSFPALEGDLDGVALAALLQALQTHRRTGTLSIRAGRREEKLYFSRGDAFLLHIDDKEADEFVAFFLGDEGAGSVSELGSGLMDRGLVGDKGLSEAEVKELKDSILDGLLWDGSTFSFFQNQLPDEFFNPGDNVTKVALATNRFLLEAMQQVGEYEEICKVIGGSRSILGFTKPDGKLKAIQALGHPEILTLIDGRQSFDDLVRISGAQRLDAARVLRSLAEEGELQVVGEKADPGDAIPDAIPDPIPD